LPLNKETTCQGQGGFVYFLRICGCIFFTNGNEFYFLLQNILHF